MVVAMVQFELYAAAACRTLLASSFRAFVPAFITRRGLWYDGRGRFAKFRRTR